MLGSFWIVGTWILWWLWILWQTSCCLFCCYYNRKVLKDLKWLFSSRKEDKKKIIEWKIVRSVHDPDHLVVYLWTKKKTNEFIAANCSNLQRPVSTKVCIYESMHLWELVFSFAGGTGASCGLQGRCNGSPRILPGRKRDQYVLAPMPRL